MASTNFKIFNEANDPATTYNDSEYSNASQRLSGVTPGMALSRMHNKMYYQWSVMATAIATFLSKKGYDAYDYDIRGIEDALAKSCGLNVRQNSTAYAVGDVAYSGDLKTYLFLECVSAGTSGATIPAALETAVEADTVTDGTVVWIVHRITSGFRQPSTAYAAQDIAYYPGLPTGWYLSCKVAGTTSNTVITLPTPMVENAEVTDGTVTWQIRKIGSGGGEAVGVIKQFAGNGDIPSGYLLCDGSAVSRTMFPDLFAAIGTTYGSGDGSTTFNLPDYNTAQRFAQGGTVAGVEKEAGLPNITGKLSVWGGSNASGAFFDDGTQSTISVGFGTSYEVSRGGKTFDASLSSAIYGNSDTVQPASLTVRFIIKAFDGQTADSALIDITQYAQELAGKVDRFDMYNPAAAHNSIYRGKDLTEYWNSGEMSAAIADGSFRDIYPGDYIIKTVTINGTTYSNVKFIVMDLDYFQPWSFGGTDKHHIVMMPEGALGTQYMNSTNITTGGYVGSYMHATHIPKVNTGIVAAFGSAHVLSHQEYLTNTVDTSKPSGAGSGYTGCATNWAAVSGLKCCLCSENMVYGGRVWGSSIDTGCASKQLAAFRHNQQLRKTTSFWLRAVSTSATFAIASSVGSATNSSATGAIGVRPYFPLA